MKRIIYILILISLSVHSYSQDFDLIINSNGDSIACHIDSITDTYIYFEMKIRENWVHTYKKLEDIAEYKINAIDKNMIKFKNGSSYFKSINRPTSIYYIPRNTLYTELCGTGGVITVNYERLIPINYNISIALRLGIFWFPELYVPREVNFLIGQHIHFLEFGVGTHSFSLNEANACKVGYRFQSEKGFMARAVVLYFPNHEWIPNIWPGLSLGYSF